MLPLGIVWRNQAGMTISFDGKVCNYGEFHKKEKEIGKKRKKFVRNVHGLYTKFLLLQEQRFFSLKNGKLE